MTYGIFTDRLQSTLDVVDLDGILELFEPRHDIADFIDHQIRGKIAVDFVDRVERAHPRFDALENPLGGTHQGCSAFVARFDQRDFLGVECRVDFLALLRQLEHKIIKLGKPSLELLDLDHQLRQVLIALFRRVTNIEIVDDALAEQLDLRMELGLTLNRQ